MTHFVDSSNNLPRLDVLGVERIGQPEQGKVSKAFNAALQAISKAFSVATPKLHALVTTNYQAARQANESINARVLDEVAFNDLIDYLIKELDSKGDTANIVDLATEYMRKNNLSIDVRSHFFRIILCDGDGMRLPKEELKTNLLTAKLNAQSCAGFVVGFTNLARSLMTTAGMNNPGSFSNVDESIRNTFQAHEGSKTEANRKYRELEGALDALEELFGHLTDQLVGRNDRSFSSVQAELEARFDKFKELMPAHFTELAVRDGEEADAPMLRFYQDLLKPNSVYLGHLKDTILSVRNELIEASKELDRVNREARSENFVSRDKKLNPLRIFKGVFSVISHATFSLFNPIKSLAESSFQSLIDKSSGSKFAVIGTITLVALYIIAEVAIRFVVALAGAVICMIGATVVFAGNKGVYMADQGIRSFRDKQKPVRPDLSVANQATIEDENRQANLLTGLRLTDFYQAYEAAVKMQALGRGYIARKAFAKAKEAAVKMQALGRGYIVRQTLKAEAKAKEAAVKMQALGRVCIARQAFEAKKEAAARLQAVLKRAPMRDEYQKLINGIKKFQKGFKAKLAQAKADEARIIKEGEEADRFFAELKRHEEAFAARNALLDSKSEGKSMTQSLMASGRARKNAFENVQPMFNSLRGSGGVSRQ